MGSVTAAATVAIGGCIVDSGRNEVPKVSYRHRFDRTGFGTAPFDAGVEFGVWESEGIEVDFDISSGSEATVQSVAGGNDEFGNAEIAAVLKLIEKGAPLRILAQETSPMGGVVSLTEADIETWADLEGRTVSRFPWAVTGPLTEAAMRERGADPTAVEWQNVNPGAEMQLLLERRIDAAIVYFPQAVARLDHFGHDTNVLVISDVLNHLGNTVITRRDVLEEDPDTVNKFMQGWYQALQLFVTDIERVIEIHAGKVAEFDEAVQRNTLGWEYASRIDPAVALINGLGWTERSRMQSTLDALTAVDILDQVEPADAYFENRFVEENRILAVETAELYRDVLLEKYDVYPDDV